MTLLKTILCFALVCAVYSHGPETDHTADCRKAESLFYSLCSPDPITLRTIQGSAGKRGAPGAKGDVGIGVQGPPGVVDYERMDSTIDQKLEQMFSEQNAKIAELTASLAKAEGREGFCDVKYNDKCFWVETNYARITCAQAAPICALRDGTPANIYSNEHHTMVMNYLRAQLLSGSDSFNIWLGLTLDISAKRLRLFDDTLAPVLTWRQTYPQYNAAWNCIGTMVRVPWDSSDQGLYNIDANDRHLREGVLCEK